MTCERMTVGMIFKKFRPKGRGGGFRFLARGIKGR